MRDWSPVLGLPLWVWLFVMPLIFAGLCFFARHTLAQRMQPLWRFLDRVYAVSGAISAFFMCVILLLIVVQMVARWSGIAMPGTTKFAGYAMAATSFFALSYALTRGAHIRVSIVLNMNRFTSRWLDLFALAGAAIIATYFARFAVKTTGFSKMLNDRTQGQDQIPEWVATVLALPATPLGDWGTELANTSSELIFTPVWIPQLAMSIGAILLAIALWDTLYRTIITGKNPIVSEAVE
jgi:TRAP-type C4-dicarboxylate transport system permease small subunit